MAPLKKNISTINNQHVYFIQVAEDRKIAIYNIRNAIDIKFNVKRT